MVIGLTDRQWRGLVKVLDMAEPIQALGERLGLNLREEGNRYRAKAEITELFEPWFAARRIEDFASAFDQAGCTWAEFRSFAEAVKLDPDLSPDNPMFSLVDQPAIGRYPVPGTPFDFSALAREAPRPAPSARPAHRGDPGRRAQARRRRHRQAHRARRRRRAEFGRLSRICPDARPAYVLLGSGFRRQSLTVKASAKLIQAR